MYQTQNWIATDDADWGVALEIIDATTNAPMDISSAVITFALNVAECGTAVLSASSGSGTITKPDDNTIQWVFTASQMAGLCAGTTYDVGVTMTTASGTQQIIVGTLAVIDGGF